MKYEVIESDGEWVVETDGVEIARFPEQAHALEEVAARLREATPGDDAVSLRMSYQPKAD